MNRRDILFLVIRIPNDIKNNHFIMEYILLIILALVVFQYREISIKLGKWFTIKAKK